MPLEVAKHAKWHTLGLSDLIILDTISIICPGCAKGKQPQHSFPPTTVHTKGTLELIHMDIKSFSTEFYHKYKYLINSAWESWLYQVLCLDPWLTGLSLLC